MNEHTFCLVLLVVAILRKTDSIVFATEAPTIVPLGEKLSVVTLTDHLDHFFGDYEALMK